MPHYYTFIDNVLSKFDGNLLATFKVIVKNFSLTFCGYGVCMPEHYK